MILLEGVRVSLAARLWEFVSWLFGPRWLFGPTSGRSWVSLTSEMLMDCEKLGAPTDDGTHYDKATAGNHANTAGIASKLGYQGELQCDCDSMASKAVGDTLACTGVTRLFAYDAISLHQS